MEKRESRKMLYKSPSAGFRGHWKEKYRERCMDRLRKSRARLIDKFRGNITEENSVASIMSHEFEAMNLSGFLQRSVCDNQGGMPCATEEDMKETLAEIQKELEDEEQRLISDYLQHENHCFDSQMNLLQSDIICPICQVGQLKEVNSGHVDMSKLLCQCGFTLQGFGLSIKMVESSLSNAVERHGSCCSSPLSFSPVQEHNTNILATCDQCDWMSFLL